ncbi:squalene/phytoene synthase family protein [Sphingobium boeckii]|uniref:Phytoene synthase n=1 Tax=Sphingobium boeckii TaxID=1082345 RepID=A0A7W9AKD4_9SPHN|nr:squalene/phytoene synthase family protein [Sphingobium boeckii]MBB5687265.1 phytoene synthase [Sphingobium boeckii]
MVNAKFATNREGADPEIQLALAYVPASKRSAMAAMWALDAQFAGIVRSTTEPLIGEMRLTWWHDAVTALGTGGAPDEPLLQRLSAVLGGTSADFEALAGMADGWSAVLEPLPLDDLTLRHFAAGRGGALFRQLGVLLDDRPFEALTTAGEGWALVDFAFRCSNRETAERAVAMAWSELESSLAHRWPKPLRPLGMLAALALRDARGGLDTPRRQGAPARLLRMMRHNLTGR